MQEIELREFSVEFGGRTRPVKFTSQQMKSLQRRFAFRSAAQWILEAVLGIDEASGTNTSHNLAAQQALLHAGLTAGVGKLVPMAKVEEWWDDAVRAGEVRRVLWTVVCAAYYSGTVTNEVVDFDKAAGIIKLLFHARTPKDVQRALDEWDAAGAAGDAQTDSSTLPSTVASDSA